MASTAGLDILEIDPNQLGKAASANTAFGAFDLVIGGKLAIQVDDGLHASPYTLPYATGDEPIKKKTALRFFVLKLTGALSADWIANFPTGKNKPFVVANATTGGHNVVVRVTGQSGVSVPAGQTFYCYLNGTDVEQLAISATAGSQPWEVGNFIDGSPTAGQVVMRWIAGRTVTFPPNFSNNRMKAGTAAAGTGVWPINKNGGSVGAATFSGGGTTPVWASSGGLAVVFNAGDIGTFAAPNPADANLADVVWNFVGTR